MVYQLYLSPACAWEVQHISHEPAWATFTDTSGTQHLGTYLCLGNNTETLNDLNLKGLSDNVLMWNMCACNRNQRQTELEMKENRETEFQWYSKRDNARQRERQRKMGKRGKPESRAGSTKSFEPLWLLVIQRGQTDGENGERKRDTNWEKGSWRNREWCKTDRRVTGHGRGVCVQRKERYNT